MIQTVKLVIVWTIFMLLLCPTVYAIRGESSEKIPKIITNAVSRESTMPQTTLSQPLSMDLSGSKISAPAGETVSVKQGTASFSYIDSVTTKTGGAIERDHQLLSQKMATYLQNPQDLTRLTT